MNHYETLRVPQNATEEEIKKAYWKLTRENHPDVHQQSVLDQRVLNAAYSVLRNRVRRELYDRELALLPEQTKPRCGNCKGEGKIYRQQGFTNRIAIVCSECGGTGYAD
jgi:curved DNA-binding protein